MYRAPYVDLTNIITDDQPKVVVEPGRRMTEIAINNIPAGVSFRVKYGSKNDWIDIVEKWNIEPRGDDESNDGFYVSNPVAQAGLKIQFVIGFGDGTPALAAM